MIILWMIAIYVVTQSVGYLVHRILHASWAGPMYRSHYTHHNVLYPPDDYFSDSYREPPSEDGQAKYYAIPAVILLSLIFYFAPLVWALVAVVEMSLIAWLNDAMHKWFHIKGHWMSRFKWFTNLRGLHWVHHVRQDTNYGIFSFINDRLVGTFCRYEELNDDEKNIQGV